jgi:hypothetical protein
VQHFDDRSELGARSRAISCPPMNLTEAEIAPRHERPHPQRIRQRSGFTEASFGAISVVATAVHRDLAEKPQRLRFIPAFLALT